MPIRLIICGNESQSYSNALHYIYETINVKGHQLRQIHMHVLF